MLMRSANKSLQKKNFPGWKCNKTIGSYISCVFIEIRSTWEVWRALKKLELLSAIPRAALMHLLCSPNFLHASYLKERTLMYEPIVNWRGKKKSYKMHFTLARFILDIIFVLYCWSNVPSKLRNCFVLHLITWISSACKTEVQQYFLWCHPGLCI